MRTPIQRFPFLISPYQTDSLYSDKNAQIKNNVNNEDTDKNISKALDDLKLYIGSNKEKLSKVLTKIGYLESAFDEFIESDQKDNELIVFFKKFIPVMDNLFFIKRAIDKSGEEEWQNGINIFYKKLFDLFGVFNFEHAAKIGMIFDPSKHEAVDTIIDNELPKGAIADIVLDGWIYKGNLLRTARVVVVKNA